MNCKIKDPVYKKIALDIAKRIYNGNLGERNKIHGRSTLAGEYNVSPETIRRAIKLLEDMRVVRVEKGSGIYIESRENAYHYLERFRSQETIGSLKKDIKKFLEEKKQLEQKIDKTVEQIIEYSERFKNITPINPIEVELTDDSHLIGKTISEKRFWQNTGGTIVGIIREGNLIISPGPYAIFQKGDILLVVGDIGVLERAKKYMKEEMKEHISK